MRALIICPGRGSYTAAELGSLGRLGARLGATELLARADALQTASGQTPVSALDAQPRFVPETMMYGADASVLTFTGTALDLARLDADKVETVCVTGNSMGWYTALYAAGVLSFDHAFTLVATMGGLQSEGSGTQVLYPLTDGDWRLDPQRVTAVETALATTGARWSIRLGGTAVLAGTHEQVRALLEALPEMAVGGRRYPLILEHHAAFHTPLMARCAQIGAERLANQDWQTARVSLVDGRGYLLRPRIASPGEIFAYTLGHQVIETFDFAAAVRVALREFAPDVIILPGPGQSLGAPVAQILVAEGWQGLACKADFQRRQSSSEPLVVAMARPEQATLVAR